MWSGSQEYPQWTVQGDTTVNDEDLARRFDDERPRLRAIAYRMLGSAVESDDALQETWLRLSRVDGGSVDNLAAWLTTVVGRVCLDMLRARATRRGGLVRGDP